MPGRSDRRVRIMNDLLGNRSLNLGNPYRQNHELTDLGRELVTRRNNTLAEMEMEMDTETEGVGLNNVKETLARFHEREGMENGLAPIEARDRFLATVDLIPQMVEQNAFPSLAAAETWVKRELVRAYRTGNCAFKFMCPHLTKMSLELERAAIEEADRMAIKEANDAIILEEKKKKEEEAEKKRREKEERLNRRIEEIAKRNKELAEENEKLKLEEAPEPEAPWVGSGARWRQRPGFEDFRTWNGRAGERRDEFRDDDSSDSESHGRRGRSRDHNHRRNRMHGNSDRRRRRRRDSPSSHRSHHRHNHRRYRGRDRDGSRDRSRRSASSSSSSSDSDCSSDCSSSDRHQHRYHRNRQNRRRQPETNHSRQNRRRQPETNHTNHNRQNRDHQLGQENHQQQQQPRQQHHHYHHYNRQPEDYHHNYQPAGYQSPSLDHFAPSPDPGDDLDSSSPRDLLNPPEGFRVVDLLTLRPTEDGKEIIVQPGEGPVFHTFTLEINNSLQSHSESASGDERRTPYVVHPQIIKMHGEHLAKEDLQSMRHRLDVSLIDHVIRNKMEYQIVLYQRGRGYHKVEDGRWNDLQIGDSIWWESFPRHPQRAWIFCSASFRAPYSGTWKVYIRLRLLRRRQTHAYV